ncbi:MAG: hypothetical protein AAGG11_06430 [Pseudomonadota bacterium]
MDHKLSPPQHGVESAEETPIAGLSEGGQFFLWCIRHWTQAMRARKPILEPLYAAHSVLGNPAIADQLDELMSLVAVSAQRKIIVRCPCAKTAHADELKLLRSVRWLQADRADKATQELENMILRKLIRPVVHSAQLYADAMNAAQMSLKPTAKLQIVK